MAKIGQYVTAQLIGSEQGSGARQGVVTQDNGDGTIVVRGELATYHCDNRDPTIIPDKNVIGSSLEHMNAVRRELGLD